MISSRPRRWSIRGIKSQILFNTKSRVVRKKQDKVINFRTDSKTRSEDSRTTVPLQNLQPQKDQCFSAGIEWAVKGASKEKSANSWRKKISGVNRKRQRRTAAHVKPLALLTQTEAALKDVEQKCVGLEEELCVKLAERGELQGDLWNRRREKGAGWPLTPLGGKSPTVDLQRERARGYAPGHKKKQSVGRRPRTRRKFKSKSFKYSPERIKVTGESEFKDFDIISYLGKELWEDNSIVFVFFLCFCVLLGPLKRSSHSTWPQTSNCLFDLQATVVSSAELFRHKWLLLLQPSITAGLRSWTCNEPGSDSSLFLGSQRTNVLVLAVNRASCEGPPEFPLWRA